MFWVWLTLTVLQLIGGAAYMAWIVWCDQSRTHANECGRTQKGYTYQDRERGRVYWYLRSKHKLSRQVAGLGEQLALARDLHESTERAFKKLREQYKQLKGDG